MDKFSLKGKKALITGGSSGIGFAIAVACAESGADIILLARNNQKLQYAANKLKAKEVDVDFFSFDLQKTEKIEGVFKKIIDRVGKIDILVNNAGVTARGAAETISPADWEYVLRVNLTSVFRLSQLFGKTCIENNIPGKIINIASLLSEAARKDNSPYASAKGGLRQLTKALAVDWAKYNINVNAIGPGYIRTELTQPLQNNEEFDSWVKGRTPLGRWGQPEDIADCAVFLASHASDFITGQIIYVDGGLLSCL